MPPDLGLISIDDGSGKGLVTMEDFKLGCIMPLLFGLVIVGGGLVTSITGSMCGTNGITGLDDRMVKTNTNL